MVPGKDPSDDSTNNPGDKERPERQPKTPDPIFREFEQQLLAPKPALTDVLLRLEPHHFEQAIDLAVSDDETLRVFRRSIRTLCENPSAEVEPFRDRLCAALAEKIRNSYVDNPVADSWKVQPLLEIAETLVAGLDLNPGPSRHLGLNHIIHASLDLIAKLCAYRKSKNLFGNAGQSKVDPVEEELKETWLDLHRTAFSLVINGLKVEGYTPPQGIARAIDRTIAATIERDSLVRSPGYSKNGFEAEAWVHPLRLTATLAKLRYDSMVNSHSAALAEICRDIVDWKLEDRVQSAPPQELAVIADNLQLCEHYAFTTLFKCNGSSQSREVWRMITQRYPSLSPGFRLALWALAKRSPADAKDALVEVLGELGESGCSDKVSRYHLETLVRFLSFPGSVEVLKDAFETLTSQEASGELRGRLMGRLQQRFNEHYEAFESAKTQVRDIESSTGESEEVIRKTWAKAGVIWSLRARKGLAKFLGTTP